MSTESVADVEAEEILLRIRRDIKCLVDADRVVRRSALVRIQNSLCADATRPLEETVNRLYFDALAHNLHKAVEDPVEGCRERAIQILSKILERITAIDKSLEVIVPLLKSRIGTYPFNETSEEIRLALIELLRTKIIDRCTARNLVDHLEDIIQILKCMLSDSFHEIKKATCNSIQSLAHKSGREFALQCTSLVRPVISNLSHQHSRVRISCLDALNAIVPSIPIGALNWSSLYDDLIVPACYILCNDRANSVRSKLFSHIAGWVVATSQNPPYSGNGSGDENCGPVVNDPSEVAINKKFWEKRALALTPVILIGLSDPDSSISQSIIPFLDNVAITWKSIANAEPAGLAATNYEHSTTDIPLITPFNAYPLDTTRAFFRRFLGEFLSHALRMLEDWTLDVRKNGVRILKYCIYIGGDQCTSHLDSIIPRFNTAMAEDDTALSASLLEVLQILGKSSSSSGWISLSVDSILASRESLNLCVNCLVVLNGLMSSAREGDVAGSDLLRLEEIFSDTRGVDSTQDVVCEQLVALTSQVIKVAGPSIDPISRTLFRFLLQASSMRSQENTASMAESCIRCLAAELYPMQARELQIKMLFSSHSDPVLKRLQKNENEWIHNRYSSDASTFKILLRECGRLGLFEEFFGHLCPFLVRVLREDVQDPGMRLDTLQILDSCLEYLSGTENLKNSNRIIRDMILPNLVWKAGKANAAVRYASIVTLHTMFSKKLILVEDLVQILESTDLLARVIGSLEEDYSAESRFAAVAALTSIITYLQKRLSKDYQEKIYPELLRSMDDSSNEVRMATVECVNAFLECLGKDGDPIIFKTLFAGLIVHMDDVEESVQRLVCDCYIKASDINSQIVKEIISENMSKHRTPHYCVEILNYINNVGM